MDMLIKFIVAAILAGTPILFGILGETMNEKAGHLNLGVEGMMAMGACGGFIAGYFSDSLIVAVLAAFLAGMLGALIYAFLTVTMMANQNVTGLTLTIFGIGLSNFMGDFVRSYAKTNLGTDSLKLPENITARLSNIDIPFLSDIPVLGDLVFSFNPYVYLGIIIAIILAIYYNLTKVGLSVRAIGENPAAADAAGIKIVKLKYINILIGGGICGIGGSYCSMITNGGVWLPDSVNGMGWIAVALVIFSTWKPSKAIIGAFVFGAFSILKYYLPKSIISVPNAVYDMLPFILTALILVITSIRQSKENAQPAACGLNYFREER